MKLGKLGLVFGLATSIGMGTYLNQVLENPEHRGQVGKVAINAIDSILPQEGWSKFETAKARVVCNSLNGNVRKFNKYLNKLLGEKGRVLYDPRTKQDLYRITQELKKLSIADMQKSNFDEDELRGFFLYVLSITDRKYVDDQFKKEDFSSLVSKTIHAVELQFVEQLIASGPMGDYIEKFTSKKEWGQGDILLALAFPKTDAQKDEFNQLLVRQYLKHTFNYKEEDFSQSKLVEAAMRLNPIETLKIVDKATYANINLNLNCVGAFTTTAAVAGGGKVIGIEVAKGLRYFLNEVNNLMGGRAQAQSAIDAKVKEYAHKFNTEGGPEQITHEFFVCGTAYGHNFN